MKSQHPIEMQGTPEEIAKVEAIYADYDEFPFISKDRNLTEWLGQVALSSSAKVPKRNMVRTSEGLLPGHIILLWRVSHGTYTQGHWVTKYFEYDYGIDGGTDIDWLVEEGYVRLMTAKESLIYEASPQLKQFLKVKEVKGFSKLNKEGLMDAVRQHYTEDELAQVFHKRGYDLTDKGRAALENNQAVVDKHPKKPGY